MPANRGDCSPDLACTRCRERKIRCGRERPQCRNCEREERVTCVYQSPSKRVNHLKLLCDSVDQLQDRLQTIESHLNRLSGAMSRGMGVHDASSAGYSRKFSRSSCDDSEHSDDRAKGHGDDESIPSGSSPLHHADSIDLQVFRNESDMVDRYHGPSSLFALCNHFRLRALATHGANDSGGLQEILQNLCEMAGSTEPFPSYSDQPPFQPLPKQQATTAVSQFLQNVDCTTDIFVPDNLVANLERVYSQPAKPGDDAWAICFKVITLLVLGMEISSQASTALVGDFARSLLPSRAALVSSRLITTPRLINVQTLILLSVAAQQLDPPGWAELIMTHACMLARIMGLQHADVLPLEGRADEAVERAKVLKSLYIRDKSLCTTRGSTSWLPSCDSNITSHLRAAVEQQAPYADRLQLAIIQDEIYRVSHYGPGRRHRSRKKIQLSLQSVEHQLRGFERSSGITATQLPQSARHAQVQLELLATQILARQKGSDPRYAQQVVLYSRVSCLLLLLVHGNQSSEVINAFSTLTGRAASPSNNPPPIADSTIPFGSMLDSFSVPAFFILLEGLLLPATSDTGMGSLTDHDLLSRVSACYTERTGQMQSNSYHREVSLIFDRTLTLIDILQTNQLNNPELVTTLPGLIDSPRPPPLDSNLSTVSDLSNIPYWPTPSASTSVSWDNLLSLPMSMGAATPLGGVNMDSMASPDPLTQMLSTRAFPDRSDPMQWNMTTGDSRPSRKRSRTQERPEMSTEKNMTSPLSSLLSSMEEVPFHLIHDVGDLSL